MQSIKLSQFNLAANRAHIRVKRWKDGAIVLTSLRPMICLRLTNFKNADWFNKSAICCYLAGREKWPPLKEFTDAALGDEQTSIALKKHRFLKLTSSSELQKAVSVIIKFGWCVDNDIYIFDVIGRWMWYVGHDTLLIYLNSNKPQKKNLKLDK